MQAPLVACREPTESYNILPKILYVFKHKAQDL